LIGTAGHTVKLVDPVVIPRAYAFVLALWSYPMLLLLVAGTWNHQRRLARFGVDKSWSSSSGRSEPRLPTGPIG
jgi:cytochrome c-type biogenesis protein CcmH/NrfF